MKVYTIFRGSHGRVVKAADFGLYVEISSVRDIRASINHFDQISDLSARTVIWLINSSQAYGDWKSKLNRRLPTSLNITILEYITLMDI